MGLGDEIMMLGEAQKRARQSGKKVWLTDRGVPVVNIMKYQHVFGPQGMGYNVDFIADSPKNAVHYEIKGPSRYWPYIGGKLSNPKGFKLIDYQPQRFGLIMNDDEKQWVRDMCKHYNLPEKWAAINPDTKTSVYAGKFWGEGKWEALIEKLDIPLVRMRPSSEPVIPGVIDIPTDLPRHAFMMMSAATMGISWEGGFVHAVSGFNVPCTVIYGHLSGPKSLGYEGNTAIHRGDGYGCGLFNHCEECKKANESITVDEVYDAVMEMWNANN